MPSQAVLSKTGPETGSAMQSSMKYFKAAHMAPKAAAATIARSQHSHGSAAVPAHSHWSQPKGFQAGSIARRTGLASMNDYTELSSGGGNAGRELLLLSQTSNSLKCKEETCSLEEIQEWFH